MSDLRDAIITSESANRMLETISPIYDKSYIGLWLHEAIGREYDDLWEIVNTLADQLFLETVTWGIELWEQRYKILSDDTLPLEKRRKATETKMVRRGAFTPSRIAALIKAILGMESYVIENVAPYTFFIVIVSSSSSEESLRRALDRIKPAHLSYELRYALRIMSELYVGGAMMVGKKIAIRQVN